MRAGELERRDATSIGATSGRPRARFDGDDGDADAPVLDETAMRAWRAFLKSHALVVRGLEAELQTGHELPLAEYDVLVQLALAGDRMLRMRELADRVVLSRGGITRLVDRLVADGLVRRQKCGDDARGAWAVLTEDGLERVRSASPCHLAAVKRLFVDAFDQGELDALASLLERVPAVSDRARRA
jgi:DNA-binding MarR family transcriptional regulator